MTRADKPTEPPPSTEQTVRSLREMAASMRRDASRSLARADSLEQAAARFADFLQDEDALDAQLSKATKTEGI